MTTNLPGHLAKISERAQSLIGKSLDNIGRGQPPRLSIEGNRFTLIDTAGGRMPMDTLYCDVVFVDVNDHKSKIYYPPDSPYDPESPEPPVCFSDNGVAPSVQAQEPQNSLCGTCPKQAWGKINQLGNKVPWCTDYLKTAILVPQASQHQQYPFLFRIPPASFGNFRAYLTALRDRQIRLDFVVTRVEFVPGSTGTLQFKPHPTAAWVSPELAPIIDTLIASRKTDALVGRLDKPINSVAAVHRNELHKIAMQGASVETPWIDPTQSQTPKAQVVVIEDGVAVPAPPIEAPPKPRNKRRQVAGQYGAGGGGSKGQIAPDAVGQYGGGGADPERFGVVNAPDEPSAIIADAIDKAFPQ